MKHECSSYTEWLLSVHYMCSCGHVEWAHHGNDRFNKGQCAHCRCTRYNGETRPLTTFELMKRNSNEQKTTLDADS